MVVVADQEGKSDNCAELSREVGKSAAPQLNTRKGGNTESKANPRVIVDMREFRSELPSLLHRRGIDIDPVTLQVWFSYFFQKCYLLAVYCCFFLKTTLFPPIRVLIDMTIGLITQGQEKAMWKKLILSRTLLRILSEQDRKTIQVFIAY